MIYGSFNFVCRFEEDARLPEFKGSTMRGSFGHALKNVTCVLKKQECPECILKESCLYVKVFETPQVAGTGGASEDAMLPHPFVIEPPLEERTDYSAGERFECGLLLFGEVVRSLPYFIHAFERMGQAGVGKRLGSSSGRFKVQEVLSEGMVIYTEEDRKVNTAGCIREIDPLNRGLPKHVASGERRSPLKQGSENQPEELPLRVMIQTPLRFKLNGKLSDGVPFPVFTRLMLRRTFSLLGAYGGGKVEMDSKGLVDRAQSVRTIDSNLRWHDWRRYSKRQESGMMMGGVVGHITYEGHLSEYLPFIQFCELVHIGKQTSFGLGKIRCELA